MTMNNNAGHHHLKHKQQNYDDYEDLLDTIE